MPSQLSNTTDVIMNKDVANILSKGECLQILKNSLPGEEINMLSYNVKCASDDLIGFAGEYFKLDVNIEDKNSPTGEKQLSYFVKSVPISNEYHKNECERKGFFTKETTIYTEILPNVQRYALSKLFPSCYYVRHDLIVLEDLSAPRLGFSQLSSGKDYTIEHYKTVLRHLAKLHAASIAWELAENVNIGEQFKHVLRETQLSTKNEWYTTGVRGILFLAKMHTKFQTPKAQTFIDEKLYKLLCTAEEFTMPSRQYRNVLCHRDCWNRNIFFKYDQTGKPIDCRVVDFQLTRYSPPAIDVLFFLHQTTNTAQRRDIYNECLDHYHNSLTACLRKSKIPEYLITKEDFLEDCKRARFAILILAAICDPILKLPPSFTSKLLAEEPEKFDYYMNTNREGLFMRVMETDPTSRDIIMTPIEELLDYVFQNNEI